MPIWLRKVTANYIKKDYEELQKQIDPDKPKTYHSYIPEFAKKPDFKL